MLTLNFKNLRDEQPLTKSRISFYVAKNSGLNLCGGFEANGEMRSGTTGFDWVGVKSQGASSCCYSYDDPEQNKLEIGYCTKFLEEGKVDLDDEYESFMKMMYLSVDNSGTEFILPFESDKPEEDEDIEILWEYEHRIQYNVFSQTPLGQDTFPAGYIKELMEDGLLTLIGTPQFRDMECSHSGYKYKHVELMFNWLGNTWIVKGSQEGLWEEDAWLDGKYAEIYTFMVDKVENTK